jgi:hypothetical protein
VDKPINKWVVCTSNTRTSHVASCLPESLSSTDENEPFVIYAEDGRGTMMPNGARKDRKLHSASSEQRAQELIGNYKIAYGQGFKVWFENVNLPAS